MVSFGVMCLTASLGGGGIFLVFKTNAINISYFKLFIKLYTTVILLYLASIDTMVTTTSYDHSRANRSRAIVNIETTGNGSNSNNDKGDTYSNINKRVNTRVHTIFVMMIELSTSTVQVKVQGFVFWT